MSIRRWLWCIFSIALFVWPFLVVFAFLLRQPDDVWTTWLWLGGAGAVPFACLFVWIDRVAIKKEWNA